MKVSVLGFELNFSDGISIGEFYQQLESVEDKEIKVHGKKHIIYTDIIDETITGIVLSYRSIKGSEHLIPNQTQMTFYLHHEYVF